MLGQSQPICVDILLRMKTDESITNLGSMSQKRQTPESSHLKFTRTSVFSHPLSRQTPLPQEPCVGLSLDADREVRARYLDSTAACQSPLAGCSRRSVHSQPSHCKQHKSMPSA